MVESVLSFISSLLRYMSNQSIAPSKKLQYWGGYIIVEYRTRQWFTKWCWTYLWSWDVMFLMPLCDSPQGYIKVNMWLIFIEVKQVKSKFQLTKWCLLLRGTWSHLWCFQWSCLPCPRLCDLTVLWIWLILIVFALLCRY